MQNTTQTIAVIAASLLLMFYACNFAGKNHIPSTPASDTTALIKRGEYLVTIGGCDDCHSPKRMGPMGPELIPELRLSGFPKNGKLPPVDMNTVKSGWALMAPDLTSAVGPWGQSFAANITSDTTGIGNWKEGNFFTAMQKGKYKGIETARNLLPPMPWFNYAKMSEEDLRAIFLFLKSTKPVKNIVPAPIAPLAMH
jgi:hypothetical protein